MFRLIFEKFRAVEKKFIATKEILQVLQNISPENSDSEFKQWILNAEKIWWCFTLWFVIVLKILFQIQRIIKILLKKVQNKKLFNDCDLGCRKIRGRSSSHPLKSQTYNDKINSDEEISAEGTILKGILQSYILRWPVYNTLRADLSTEYILNGIPIFGKRRNEVSRRTHSPLFHGTILQQWQKCNNWQLLCKFGKEIEEERFKFGERNKQRVPDN